MYIYTYEFFLEKNLPVHKLSLTTNCVLSKKTPRYQDLFRHLKLCFSRTRILVSEHGLVLSLNVRNFHRYHHCLSQKSTTLTSQMILLLLF